MRFGNAYSFNDNMLYFFPYSVNVNSQLFKISKYAIQASFVTLIILLCIFIVNKLSTFFINSVISKMHIGTFQIRSSRTSIRHCSKSRHTFVVYKYFKRADTSNQNINSKVKFESFK